MAKIGFGTYRITEHNPEHIEALKHAIKENITLIDTSNNYMNGEAERAIALAMNQLADSYIANVKIISKFGYIQGTLLEEIKKNDNNYNNIIKFKEHVYYCIDKKFMQDELTKSLNRLNVSSIEAYLVHNPEYYLFDDMNNGLSRGDALDNLYEKLFEVFKALEEEVASGRIKYYGISSNSFSKSSDDLEFLPYEDLISIANQAALEAKQSEHHFKYFELPINLLEQHGLTAAKWAKKNGCTVLSNRPLNAQIETQMYRLAEYNDANEYYHALNVISDLCDEVGLNNVANLLVQLDEKRHKYSWIGEYEQFLHVEIIPYLQNALKELDENQRYQIANQINIFLDYYHQMVAHELGQVTRKLLESSKVLSGCEQNLQICALQFLLQCDDIDYILLGMRNIAYVNEVTQINS